MTTISEDPVQKRKSHTVSSERLTGLILLVLAIGALIHLQQLNPPDFAGDPGPTLFPSIAAAGLGVCGLLIAVAPSKSQEAKNSSHLGLSTRFFLTFLAYVGLLQIMGFYISTPIFLATSYLVLAKKNQIRWLSVVALSIGVTLIVGLVFSNALDVILPRGVF